eukprot:gnl/TRDRNA2_/TRDRNA2_166029_c1_seq1.p1 gnl/TRDRNA2_/TRDRNA2_166029_c1~~gnl/TRDRNA2_/TRDRNA2_166029_c1_seq1.p1  ORF type:complete len:292 (+),score=52.33 gnl/TRDRNA2_/TRDRNA2_166029_c1_seq1:72-878(+)
MVAAHDLQDVVTVVRGRVEDLELPEKVDVIISEWMGRFLVGESMVQSVLVARDRWLKPAGVMYPSSARLFVAELDKRQAARAQMEMEGELAQWDGLSAKLASRYSLRLDTLRPAYSNEKFAVMFRRAWQGQMPEAVVVGESQVVLDLDMHTVTNEQLLDWTHMMRLQQASTETPVHGLISWFDVRFCGKEESPAEKCIDLDTSPAAAPTHWGHTAFLLVPPLTSPDVSVQLTQSLADYRDLNMTLRYDDMVASYFIAHRRGVEPPSPE